MSAELNYRESTGETDHKNDRTVAAEWMTHPATAVVKAAIGRSVLIVLNDGRELKGICTCFDWLGNLVLTKWTQSISASSSGTSHFASNLCVIIVVTLHQLQVMLCKRVVMQASW